MGAVYLAQEVTLGVKRVAIKEMAVDIQDAERRRMALAQFHEEARILASLDHPGLVDVSHYFDEGGKQYLVMAYIDGQTLETLVNRNESFYEIHTVMDWLDQMCDVLEYLHTHDPPIIFRDLKPSNVMLDNRNRIRLIDFGIARSFDQSKTVDFIKGVGTVGFAPLEQFGNSGSSDPRTDVYALGATAYSILTRSLPPSAVDLVTREVELVPPRRVNPAVSPALEAVILKMMALQKGDRYATMAQARDALRLAQSAPARLVPQAGEARRPVSLGGELQVRRGPQCSRCSGPLAPDGRSCPRCDAPRPRADTTPALAGPPRPDTSAVLAGPVRTVDALPPVPAEKPLVEAAIEVPSSFLDFLKTSREMEKVKVVDLGPDRITFQVARQYKLPVALQMKVAVKPLVQAGNRKAKPVTFDVKVTVQSGTSKGDGTWEYQAGFRDLPAQVRSLLAMAPTKERRGARRYKEGFQVLSRELPGFKALAVDISETGVGLVADGPVAEGTVVELSLDLGDNPTSGAGTRLTARARVVHCTKRPDGRYRLGLCFVTMAADVTRQIHEFLRRL